MKLFKSLLVAPAALGLLAPMSVTANEINLTDVSGYSSTAEVESISDFDAAKELAVTNSRVDGLEARVNNFEAGAFSETTTASFGADFIIGAEDGTDAGDSVQAGYSFGMKLSTSFTGEDSLVTKFDAGNAGGQVNEFGANSSAANEALEIDGVSYTFPVMGATVFVGDSVDGSSLFSTACVYGGPGDNLDDCGNGSSAIGKGGGTALGASYEFDNGLSVAVGYTGDGNSTNGLATKEGNDSVAAQVTYTADTYGVSLTGANVEASNNDGRNYVALNGYWTPSDAGAIPSISLGYEKGTAQKTTDTRQWFAGLQWDEAGPGTFGVAVGTVGASTDGPDTTDPHHNDPELIMYEAYYSYPVNDGMTITPLIYTKETVVGSDDLTGVMVKTSFSF